MKSHNWVTSNSNCNDNVFFNIHSMNVLLLPKKVSPINQLQKVMTGHWSRNLHFFLRNCLKRGVLRYVVSHKSDFGTQVKSLEAPPLLAAQRKRFIFGLWV